MRSNLPGIVAIAITGFVVPLLDHGQPSSFGAAGPEQEGSVRRFEDQLKERLADFDGSGRPMVPLLLGIAYKYKLPMGFEYVDSDAVRRPIKLRLKGRTLRDSIGALVATAPGLRVDFSGGLVDIYSVKGRSENSNPFNITIRAYDVDRLDTHRASAELLNILMQQIHPHAVVLNSIAPGQWGDLGITLHMRDRKVYEILNAIVAQTGSAVWISAIPAGHLTTLSTNVTKNFWYIYPLDSAFESMAVERADSLFPSPAKGDLH